MAKPWTGWSTSATNSTRPDRGTNTCATKRRAARLLRSWQHCLRRPFVDPQLDANGLGPQPKTRPVGQRHNAVNPFPTDPRAILAAEILDRRIASHDSQPRVMARDRFSVDIRAAAAIAAEHGRAG